MLLCFGEVYVESSLKAEDVCDVELFVPLDPELLELVFSLDIGV